MKWFAKFKISNALDSDTDDSASAAIQTCRDLAEFQRKAIAVEVAIKRQVPGAVAVPEGLHGAIMREVARANAASSGIRPRTVRMLLPRWAPVCVAGLLVLALGWLVLRDSTPLRSPPEDIAVAAAPLLSLEDLAQRAPAAVTAPLATELDRLQADLNATARFLLASVP